MAVFDETGLTLRDGAEVTLRSPREADAAALLAYLDAVRRETPFLLFDPADSLPTLDAERAWVRSYLESDAALLLMAEAGGEPVALADLSCAGKTRQRHLGGIGISVRAAWCDRGLGTRLMQELVIWARRHPRITVLHLTVLADNPRAVRVYQKAGFTIDGRRRWVLRYPDGRYADDLVMSCWVGEGPPVAEPRAVGRL